MDIELNIWLKNSLVKVTMVKRIFAIVLAFSTLLMVTVLMTVNANAAANPVDYSGRIESNGQIVAVIDGNHNLWMWGGSYGNVPQQVMSDAAYVSLGGKSKTQIAVIKTDKSLWMWEEFSEKPKEPTMANVRDVWAATSVQLVLQENGTLWMYDNISGAHASKQLMTDVVSAFVTENEIVVLTKDGVTWQWYDYDYKGPKKNRDDMSGATGVFSTGGLGSYILFEMNDGSLKLGKNRHITDVASFNVSENRLVVVKTDNTLWEWTSGKGEIAQTMSDVVAASTSSEHTTIIKKDGTLWLAGDNEWGMSGLGYNRKWKAPEQVLENVTYATASHSEFISDMQAYNLILAVKSDGSIWAFGNNASGQVGNGGSYDVGDENNNYVKSPCKVVGLNMFSSAPSADAPSTKVKTENATIVTPTETEAADISTKRSTSPVITVMVIIGVIAIGGMVWTQKRKK